MSYATGPCMCHDTLRNVYQGLLFVGDRLLNESGMEDHPLTPMKDADLRRVLARACFDGYSRARRTFNCDMGACA